MICLSLLCGPLYSEDMGTGKMRDHSFFYHDYHSTTGKKLNKEDLKALLRYVKRSTDNAKLPDSAQELRFLWDERKGRLPTIHPM